MKIIYHLEKTKCGSIRSTILGNNGYSL